MNNSNEELDIHSLLKEAPASQETPSQLQSKLRQMAAKPPVRRPSPWTPRLAMAGVGAIAIAMVAISMNPAKASAKSFQKVLNAVNQTNTFELSIESTQANGQHKFTVASAGGKLGMSADNGALIQIDGSKMSIYDPAKNEVTELDLGGIVDPKTIADEIQKGISQGLKEMDLKKMLNDYSQKYGPDNIQIGPIEQKFGRSMYEVILQSPKDQSHVDMWVNADSDLPEQINIDNPGANGNDAQHASIHISFGGSVDENLATPTFPANAKHVKLDLGNLIEQGMKGEKGDLKHLGGMINLGMKHFNGFPNSGGDDSVSK